LQNKLYRSQIETATKLHASPDETDRRLRLRAKTWTPGDSDSDLHPWFWLSLFLLTGLLKNVWIDLEGWASEITGTGHEIVYTASQSYESREFLLAWWWQLP